MQRHWLTREFGGAADLHTATLDRPEFRCSFIPVSFQVLLLSLLASFANLAVHIVLIHRQLILH